MNRPVRLSAQVPMKVALKEVLPTKFLPYARHVNDEMVMLDLYYAEYWSLALDLKIMLRSIPNVILGTGAY